MPRLLVSVRNAEEATAACRCGVHILDMKEPADGSLGAVSPVVFDQILSAAATYRAQNLPIKISAAMGELSHFDVSSRRMSKPSSSRRIDYAKVGVANLATDRLRVDWPRWRDSLACGVRGVMVAYADRHEANAPQIEDVLQVAMEVQAAGLLIDTYRKTSKNLFDYVEVSRLIEIVRRAQQAGLFVALAGSLSGRWVTLAARTGADVIAVRGAACDDGREGRLSMVKIRGLQQRLSQQFD